MTSNGFSAYLLTMLFLQGQLSGKEARAITALNIELASQSSTFEQQSPQPPASSETQEALSREAARRARAISLINNAAIEVSKIDNLPARATLLAQAGKTLWPVDREAARKLFIDAFESAMRYYRESRTKLASDPTADEAATLPREIVDIVSAVDVGLGREMQADLNAERTRQRKRPMGSAGGLPSEEHLYTQEAPADGDASILDEALSLSTADESARKAKELFARSVARTSAKFFWRLSFRDRSVADQLFFWLLNRIRNDETAGAGQMQVIANYPFALQLVVYSDGRRGITIGTYWLAKSWQSQINAAREHGSEGWLRAAFIDVSFVVISRTLRNDISDFPDSYSRIGGAVFLGRWLVPYVERYRPELLIQWKGMVDALEGRLPPEQMTELDKMEGLKGTAAADLTSSWKQNNRAGDALVRQLLDQAAKTSEIGQRDFFLEEAALEADRVRDVNWAIDIAGKLSKEENRSILRRWIFVNSSRRALRDGVTAEARRYALSVDAVDQRAHLLAAIARAAYDKNDKEGALSQLNEADQVTGNDGDQAAASRGWISIAKVLSKVDVERAFDVIAQAISAINQHRQFPYQQKITRSLPSNFSRSDRTAELLEEVDVGHVLASLAQRDFERALGLAESFEAKTQKYSAIIAVCAKDLATGTSQKVSERVR